MNDLANKRFGRFVAIKPNGKNKKGEIIWECQCDCGNKTNVSSVYLRNGHTTSCGCYKKICSIKHSQTGTRLYQIWQNMKNRCRNENVKNYKNYGARNIIVCDEWYNDFQAFYDWAIANGYADNLTIDRINVNGNYEPSNCRWATIKQQCNNMRKNIFLEYNGERKTIQEWAEYIGVEPKTVRKRYYDGMQIENILYKGDLRCQKKKSSK